MGSGGIGWDPMGLEGGRGRAGLAFEIGSEEEDDSGRCCP